MLGGAAGLSSDLGALNLDKAMISGAFPNADPNMLGNMGGYFSDNNRTRRGRRRDRRAADRGDIGYYDKYFLNQ